MGRPRTYGPRTRQQWQRDVWYQNNTQLTKDRALGSKRRTQNSFKEMKLNDIKGGCSICGIKTGNPNDYDYHHRDPKTKVASLSDMVGRGSWQSILNEAAKCDIVCKSCHAKIHKPDYPFHQCQFNKCPLTPDKGVF